MKSMILVIDMQRALFEADPQPYEADAVIERINHLISRARDNNIPVAFTRHEHPGRLDAESAGWHLHPDLIVGQGDIMIAKTRGDAFLHTTLADELNKRCISDLIICGYATEICVDTTVRRASGLGYTIQLVADAHTTQDKTHLSAEKIREHHNVTLSMGPGINAINHDRVHFS